MQPSRLEAITERPEFRGSGIEVTDGNDDVIEPGRRRRRSAGGAPGTPRRRESSEFAGSSTTRDQKQARWRIRVICSMDLQLVGRRAIVTGSTAGIGLATARLLAAEGARVVVNGRTAARVEEAVGAIVDAVTGAEVRGVAADLGTAAGCEALIREVPDADILVNNVGIFAPQAVRGDLRCRLAPVLRGERAERGAAVTPLHERDAERATGGASCSSRASPRCRSRWR